MQCRRPCRSAKFSTVRPPRWQALGACARARWLRGLRGWCKTQCCTPSAAGPENTCKSLSRRFCSLGRSGIHRRYNSSLQVCIRRTGSSASQPRSPPSSARREARCNRHRWCRACVGAASSRVRGFVRLLSDAGDLHPSRGQVDDEENMEPNHAGPGDHFNGEEVHRRDGAPMSTQKGAPRRALTSIGLARGR